MILQANEIQNSSKIGYIHTWQSKITKDYEAHYILNKGTVHKEEIMIINKNALNIGVPNVPEQTLTDIKAQIQY
jgi:hypothetical protein